MRCVIFHGGPVEDQFLFMKMILAEEQPFFHEVYLPVFCQRGMMPQKLVGKYQGYFVHDCIQNKAALKMFT